MTSLTESRCITPKQGLRLLAPSEVDPLLAQIQPDWEIDGDTQCISRTFKFSNYYETIAFVNALAWIAHGDDHHPDLEVGYNRCVVRYTTHAVKGLSKNDFICAAKIDKLTA